MASQYKNIPVDPETYRIVQTLAAAHERKLGAQVKVMAKAEYEKLTSANLTSTAQTIEIVTPKG